MLKFLTRWRRGAESNKDHFSFVVVGYPKVGNTWLRVTLGRYVQQIAHLPDIPLFEPYDAALLSNAVSPAAAGYFTHAPLEWEKQTAKDLTQKNTIEPFRNYKTILLVRHPLDALVSFHKQKMHRDKSNKFEGGLVEFIENPVFGLEKLIKFYAVWHECRASSRVFLWRYEDAKCEPEKLLKEIVAFLELPLNEEMIADAVNFGAFENMKVMEKNGANLKYRSSGFGIFATGDPSNPDAFHVRKGEVGGFRAELGSEDIRRFESVVRNQMPAAYGYC